MDEHPQDPDIHRDEDRFVEPTPVPIAQEADQHHHRPQDPAEGPDLDDESLHRESLDKDSLADSDGDDSYGETGSETGSDDTLEQDRP